MNATIAENQCTFIKRRHILDCCLIANELVEDIRVKKKKWWVFKVDLEKTYENVDWRFFDFVLIKKGFGEDEGDGRRVVSRMFHFRFLSMEGLGANSKVRKD